MNNSTAPLSGADLVKICRALGYPTDFVNPDGNFFPEHTQAVMNIVHQKLGICFALSDEFKNMTQLLKTKNPKFIFLTNHPTHFNIALIQMALAKCLSGGNKTYEKVQELGQISTTLVGPRVFAEEMVRMIATSLSNLLLTIPTEKIKCLLADPNTNAITRTIATAFQDKKNNLLDQEQGIMYIAPIGTTDPYRIHENKKQYIYPQDRDIEPALSLVDEFVTHGYSPIILLTDEDFEAKRKTVDFILKPLDDAEWFDMRLKKKVMPTFADMMGGNIMAKKEINKGKIGGELRVQNIAPLITEIKSFFK